MQRAENDALIKSIFSDKKVFEKEILNVTCNSDRIEVIDILAKRLIRILLKEELNFLHMRDLNSFKFSLIVNLLFREIANEWVSYADEYLGYEKSEALDIIQDKTNVMFVLTLIKEYFSQYKIYFVQEIADSFIDLIESMPSPTLSNTLINEVLKSDFVKKDNISVVFSYSQLWGRVQNAHNAKKEKITKLQIMISEAKNSEELRKLEYKEEALEVKPLAFFNDALLRLRNTMVQYMMTIDAYPKR
ncbi:hypothetical protein JHD47_04680 [Sulfurimonas sp. SAG-AH-194-L11]|nr:hypothetical protein [Sulfurimonas sp. SAG-AH-194-L11]MDF1877104.1 hypothetical protein [Sulfurimonas sp. SAG-AH-194-L11]